MATVEGDANDEKILGLALGDDDSENAFEQGIGLGVGMVFDLNDGITRPRILSRMRLIFRRFEQLKRYKMRESTIKWLESEGELVLEFKYVNLESDEEKVFRRRFRGAGEGTRSEK